MNRYLSLLLNILLVYVLYAVCRVLFIVCNLGLLDTLTFSQALHLMQSGLVFDSSAICYSNILLILMFFVPVPRRAYRVYYTVAHWIYVITNSICLIANLADVGYFPFTGKRTTWSVFSEFSNEGTLGLMRIIGALMLQYWWLVLIMVLLVVVLWKGFRAPHPDKERWPLAVRIPVNVCLFLVVGYTCWGLMRGGFTGATHPITISNACKYADTPSQAAVVLNTPFSLLRTANKRALVTPNYMPMAEAEAIFTPLHVADADTTRVGYGVAKGMNVVVFIMESFGKQHIGYYNIDKNENGDVGDKHTFTPFLDSLMRTEALTYRYSYANSRKSIEGMPAVLSSIPNFVEPIVLTPASMNNLSGLARELSENKGYHSAFFHGAENGSMGFEAFANSTGFQEYYGRTEYGKNPKFHGDDDFDGTWAIWDEEFMQFFADEADHLPQPFMAALFTATSHTPFKIPERYASTFPKGKSPLQECVAYSDYALRQFFATARKKPWFDNTIFVITADHTSQPVDPFYQSALGSFCVPVIIYAPGIEGLRGYDEKTIAQHVDIMPTLMNLLGYDLDYLAFGKDLLNTPASESFALHWIPEINGYQMVMDGYCLRHDGKDAIAAYNIIDDPLQRVDILDQMPADVLERMLERLKAEVQMYLFAASKNGMTADSYKLLRQQSAEAE